MQKVDYPFISPIWLKRNLNNPKILIADCRWSLTDRDYGLQSYMSSHIPDAFFLSVDSDLAGEVVNHGGRHPLPDVKKFEKKMNSIGLTQEKTVICYDNDYVGASRLWWLLTFFGHTKVKILNGGYKGWTEHGFPVSKVIPKEQEGSFKAVPSNDIIIDHSTIKNFAGKFVIVDSRQPERCRGEFEPIDKKAGHIPGAINIPYSNAISSDGNFKTVKELKKIYDGVGRDVVVYCGSGVTACVNFLGIYSVGIKPKLYAGSWSDWVSYQDNPVETASEDTKF